MNPMISIIVPVYNAEQHLERCISSLSNQKYPYFEIILINDGSSDNSGIICDDFLNKNKNIKVFHTKNCGVSNARNVGIENARGDYIQFVDSDDFINEYYISRMVEQIQDKNIDLVIGGINHVNFESNKINILREIKSKKEGHYTKGNLKLIIDELINVSYINYCYSKLISRKLLIDNNIRFDINISLGEDTLFVLDMIKASNNIYISTHADYFYVIHSNETLTYKYRPDKFEILNNLSLRLTDFCQQEGLYSDEVKEALEKRYMEMIRFCLDENFKQIEGKSFLNVLKNIGVLLRNQDVSNFIYNDKDIFNLYPKSLINAIRSKSALKYFYTYYFLIILRKLRYPK
ncbi:MAG: N-acetylglucosaminyltransferase [Bacillales bacterium]|jgi:glycosyltransferase involved in cell wall biosynthesis|nr:N-acetylglucosaminyltransferase [Bacillales bacterium]